MAQVVLARRARQELLELNWPLTDAVEDALGLLEGEPLLPLVVRAGWSDAGYTLTFLS